MPKNRSNLTAEQLKRRHHQQVAERATRTTVVHPFHGQSGYNFDMEEMDQESTTESAASVRAPNQRCPRKTYLRGTVTV